MEERDLTPEGQQLLENILSYGKVGTKQKVMVSTENKTRKSKYQIELERIKRELCIMLLTSKMVIEDAKLIVKEIETPEEYMKSDAKIAITLHEKNVDRLERVLLGMTAYQNPIHINPKELEELMEKYSKF